MNDTLAKEPALLFLGIVLILVGFFFIIFGCYVLRDWRAGLFSPTGTKCSFHDNCILDATGKVINGKADRGGH